MKAVVFRKYGSVDVLRMEEVPRPDPSDHEVLVRVGAVSLNDWDLGLISGKPFVNRISCGLFSPRKINIPGSDIAGTIEKVGAAVTKFKAGDRVYGDLSETWGGCAEYVCAGESSLAPIAPSMTFPEAASLPQAGMLAVQGLLDYGQLKKGMNILINGGGGGVGTIGVQIAKHKECRVTGVDKASKAEIMISAGFDETLDYKNTDFTTLETGYDLILDTKTNRPVRRFTRVLNPGGAYYTVGGEIKWLLKVLLAKPYYARRGMNAGVVMLKPNKDLSYLSELHNRGKLKTYIHGPFPFAHYSEAFKLYEQADQNGKIVLTLENA